MKLQKIGLPVIELIRTLSLSVMLEAMVPNHVFAPNEKGPLQYSRSGSLVITSHSTVASLYERSELFADGETTDRKIIRSPDGRTINPSV